MLKNRLVDPSDGPKSRCRSSVVLMDMQEHFLERHLREGRPTGALETLCNHQITILDWMGRLPVRRRPRLFLVEYYGHGDTLSCLTEAIRKRKLSYTPITKWADYALASGQYGQSRDGRDLEELLGNCDNSNGILLSGIHSSLCVTLFARGLVSKGYTVLLPHKCHGDFLGKFSREGLPGAAETQARILSKNKAPAGRLYCDVTLAKGLQIVAGR